MSPPLKSCSDLTCLFRCRDQKSLLSSIEVALNPTGVSTGFDNKWSNLALNFTTLPESTQINAVVLYAAIVKASRPEAFGPSLSLHLCQMVWQKAMSWTDDVGKIAAFKTLAVCSNKSPNGTSTFSTPIKRLIICSARPIPPGHYFGCVSSEHCSSAWDSMACPWARHKIRRARFRIRRATVGTLR